jgi:hypothetical protein
VSPSNQVLVSGLKQKESEEATSMYGLGKAFMFLFSTYSTHSHLMYEGDEVSIFGVLKYQVKSDEFTIDNPIGFI